MSVLGQASESRKSTTNSNPGWITKLGLAVVGVAAAILTFTALHDLAVACGITGSFLGLPLAWLVPVTVDAAGVVAVRVWLLREGSAAAARLARRLAWVCVFLSIAGNATQHGMSAYGAAPGWIIVVLVSAVPPAMLGAVVHLITLVTRAHVEVEPTQEGATSPGDAAHGDVVPEPSKVVEAQDEITQPIPVPSLKPLVKVAAAERTAPEVRVAVKPTPAVPEPAVAPPAQTGGEETRATADPRVDQLIAWARDEGGMPSQRKVIERFGVHNKTAKKLVEAAEASRVNGTKVI